VDFTTKLRETATHWPPGGTPDGYGGENSGSPVALTVRWEDKQELFLDVEGEEQMSKAKVFSTVRPEIKGFLALGDHTGEADPIAGAREIRQIDDTPSLDVSQRLYTTWL
jgi:hypothetical protein